MQEQYGPIGQPRDVKFYQSHVYQGAGLYVGITSRGEAYVYRDGKEVEITVEEAAQILTLTIEQTKFLLARRGLITRTILEMTLPRAVVTPTSESPEVGETISSGPLASSKTTSEPTIDVGEVSDETVSERDEKDSSVVSTPTANDLAEDPQTKVDSTVAPLDSNEATTRQGTEPHSNPEQREETVPPTSGPRSEPSWKERIRRLENTLPNCVTQETFQQVVNGLIEAIEIVHDELKQHKGE